MSASKRRGVPSTSAMTPVDRRSRGVGLELQRPGLAQQDDIGPLDRRADGDHLGVGLGMDETGEAVAGLAADAAAVGHIRFVHHHGRGGVKRMIAGSGEIRRRASRCAARARRAATDKERWRADRSDRVRVLRAPDRGARLACNRAPFRRSRSARPATRRRSVSVRRSPAAAGDRAPRRRPWSRRRQNSGPAAGRAFHPPSATSRARHSGWRRRHLRRSSCAPRAAASRRARGSGSFSRRAPDDGRACRRRRRCR